MPCSVVVCGFFGDTGKGKVISYLALKDKLDITARAGVGPNAGHTVVVDGKKYGLSMLPSAFMNEKCRLLIGPGVLVNPDTLFREMRQTETEDRVGIDSQCAIIEARHIEAVGAGVGRAGPGRRQQGRGRVHPGGAVLSDRRTHAPILSLPDAGRVRPSGPGRVGRDADHIPRVGVSSSSAGT